jgi:hypothetical protein
MGTGQRAYSVKVEREKYLLNNIPLINSRYMCLCVLHVCAVLYVQGLQLGYVASEQTSRMCNIK